MEKKFRGAGHRTFGVSTLEIRSLILYETGVVVYNRGSPTKRSQVCRSIGAEAVLTVR